MGRKLVGAALTAVTGNKRPKAGKGTLLSVRDLTVAFPADGGKVRAVDGISYDMAPGRTLGVVGESGSGKTIGALALLRLVPPPGRVVSGEVLFEGSDLMSLGARAMRGIRGDRISMIFQEPMMALNPVYAVGEQVAESLRIHQRLKRSEARAGAVDMLDRVGIPAPAQRARDYPHQLSGG
ncbi:MAG: ATP-binding cassette domain-containing protein, partial [Alphaproteobacteria bacterium]